MENTQKVSNYQQVDLEKIRGLVVPGTEAGLMLTELLDLIESCDFLNTVAKTREDQFLEQRLSEEGLHPAHDPEE